MQSGYAQYILRIKAARKNLTRSTCNKLMVTLVLSHLDYANSLLGKLPTSSINKMQAVQNIAAKITLGKGKYDSTTRCLQTLHWLPIKERIDYKIISLVYKCIHGWKHHHTKKDSEVQYTRKERA